MLSPKRQLVDFKLQMDESVKEVKSVSTQTITQNTEQKLRTESIYHPRSPTVSAAIQTISITTIKNTITNRTNFKQKAVE